MSTLESKKKKIYLLREFKLKTDLFLRKWKKLTCIILRAFLMSPNAKWTNAFRPSSFMSTLNKNYYLEYIRHWKFLIENTNDFFILLIIMIRIWKIRFKERFQPNFYKCLQDLTVDLSKSWNGCNTQRLRTLEPERSKALEQIVENIHGTVMISLRTASKLKDQRVLYLIWSDQ